MMPFQTVAGNNAAAWEIVVLCALNILLEAICFDRNLENHSCAIAIEPLLHDLSGIFSPSAYHLWLCTIIWPLRQQLPLQCLPLARVSPNPLPVSAVCM